MFQYGSWDDARTRLLVSVDLWAARTAYLRACRAGDARGCNAVGYLYGTGTTDVQANQVPRDYALAVKFYERSCQGGLPLGCFNVGVMYESGYGVRKDYAAAAMMYERACAGGNSNACSSLGVFLFAGTAPVWSDPPRGIELLRKGCAGGNDWGCQQLKSYGYEP
jgi:TPR repeat protein